MALRASMSQRMAVLSALPEMRLPAIGRKGEAEDDIRMAFEQRHKAAAGEIKEADLVRLLIFARLVPVKTPAYPAAASHLPSGESAMAKILPGSPGALSPRMMRVVFPVARSHTRMVLSSEAETSCLPSGVKVMSLISAICPPVSSMSCGRSSRGLTAAN